MNEVNERKIVLIYIKQEKRQSDCSGGELSPQPHINNIGLCVHYMIYRIKLINNKVIQSNNINYVKYLGWILWTKKC